MEVRQLQAIEILRQAVQFLSKIGCYELMRWFSVFIRHLCWKWYCSGGVSWFLNPAVHWKKYCFFSSLLCWE